MARDRQRAKQRQRQRQQRAAQSGQPSGEETRDKRDSQDEARAHDPEVSPGTNPRADDFSAAPDPLGDAAPDVDIAELAEEGIQEPGAPTDRPLGEKDYPHPDELVEVDATEEELEAAEDELDAEYAAEDREDPDAAVGRPARRGRAAGPGEATPKGENRLIAFLRASWAELQRVQWPNRRQVAQATAVTLVFVVIAGGYLGIADAVFSRLVEAIL
jgi:preprotein translocase SecE subunit